MTFKVKSDKINSFGESQRPSLWRNPEDNVIYATYKSPKYGFKDAGAWPIYDLNAHQSNIKQAQSGTDLTYNAFLDSETENKAEQYISDINAGGRIREAALRSYTNSDVDILNIWTEVLGKKDRQYAGKNMAKEIPVPNLLIDIDTANKFQGMVRIDEGQQGGGTLKELTYTRQPFEAKKYGLKFIIHEESRLKSHENILQDSIQVASTKVEQRQSYDTIAVLDGLRTISQTSTWDSFGTGGAVGNSASNPLLDIGRAQLNIEAANVGGKMSRVGMHPITYMKYRTNTHLRGVASVGPVGYDFEPGTTALQGVEGVGLVLDPGFDQRSVFCVATEVEPAVAFFQGPQRIGSEHDQESGDDKYFIVDYHEAAIIQPETGVDIEGVATATNWVTTAANIRS